MSGKALEWASLQKPPGRSKATLMALAWFHNHTTGRCDPGKDSLWKISGLRSDRTVDSHIALLADAGLISVIAGGGRNHTNSYTLEIGCSHCMEQDGPWCDGCLVNRATTAGFENGNPATTAPFSSVNPAINDTKPRNKLQETPQLLHPNKVLTRNEQGILSEAGSSLPAKEISIPLKDGSEYPVSESQVQDWVQAYPRIDVMQALREIRQWNVSNQAKRKTKSGIPSHINSWLKREHDKVDEKAKLPDFMAGAI